MSNVQIDIRNRWTGELCYLDGKLAKVTGRQLRFARIAPCDVRYASIEFSWEAVDLIMKDNRHFSS